MILFQQIFVVPYLSHRRSSFHLSHIGIRDARRTAQAAMYASYLRALQVEEASRVVSLIFVYPVLVFLGAALLLGEVLTLRHYVGGFFLVVSALLIPYRRTRGPWLSLQLSTPHLFLDILRLYAIGIKYLLSSMGEWHL